MARSRYRMLVAALASLVPFAWTLAQAPIASAAVPAVSFSGSTLTITGDSAGGDVVLSHDPSGTIVVTLDGVVLPTIGGPSTLSNTDEVKIGLLCDSALTVNETNGYFASSPAHVVHISNAVFWCAIPVTILGQSTAADNITLTPTGFDLTDDGAADLAMVMTHLSIYGNGGDDHVNAAPASGNSCALGATTTDIYGGRGNDVMSGTIGGGPQRLDGGPGDDTIVANLCPFLQGQAAPSIINGGAGNDTITGGAKAGTLDVIRGGAGNDTITGDDVSGCLPSCGGSDRIMGQGGDDTILASDGHAGNDTVIGKAGTDACTADTGDSVTGCETVTFVPPAPRASAHRT